MKLAFAHLVGVLGSLLILSPLAAQAPSDTLVPSAPGSTAPGSTAEIAELRARLDNLEQQNDVLRRAIVERGPGAASLSADGASPGSMGLSDQSAAQGVASAEGLSPIQGSASFPAQPSPSAAETNSMIKAFWKDGYLWFESPKKNFTMHIGGRTQVDAVFLQAPQHVENGLGYPGTRDAVDFRRARFRMEGTMYESMDYTMEYDFINAFNLNATTPIEEVAPLDLWWGFRDVPLFQYIRIGNQKEGLGLERIQSSRWLEFMERSFNNDAVYSPYSNGFSPGISMLAFSPNQRWSVHTGFYKNTTNPWQFGVSDGAYASTTRFTWLPLYDEACKGRYLLHFGSSISFRGQDNDMLRQRVRGPLRNGPSSLIPAYLNTGTNLAGAQTIVNQEIASVLGPWQISGEYYLSATQDVATPQGNYLGEYLTQGGYVQALYFLTGEHRPWDRTSNVYSRVIPRENATIKSGGIGAWQIGARYQYQNFPQFSSTPGGINAFGGQLHGADAVLNWWLNPNTHMVFDYSFVERNAPGTAHDGPINGFGTRFAFDF